MTSLEKFVFLDDARRDKIWTIEDRRLTLAYEGLLEVPRNLIEDHGRYAEILDLTNNKLAHLDFLHHFESLTTLILDHNYITDDIVFPYMPSVTTLWLNHNLVDRLHPFLSNLNRSFPNLQMLSLMGNTAAPSYLNGGTYYEFLQYRLFVISWLPNLTYLDDRPVTNDQREEANRLYGRPFYQTINAQLPQYLRQFHQKLKCIVNTCLMSGGASATTRGSNENRIV